MPLEDIVNTWNPWWRDSGARPATVHPVRRDVVDLLQTLVGQEGQRRAALLVGPRQVGKTVALLQLADAMLRAGWPAGNITYFDFSDDRLVAPVAAREVVELAPTTLDPTKPRLLLFDEITRSERWDAWLKQAVDANLGRIVATDSAASLLRRGGSESGQGRWDEIPIEGLSFREYLKIATQGRSSPEDAVRAEPNLLTRYLSRGGFPEHVFDEDLRRVRLRIRADIADRAVARDLASYDVDIERVRVLLSYLVQDSGAIFSARERAQALGVDERSVRSWVHLLEDAGLVRKLDRYTAAQRATSRLKTKPRLYAADHGAVVAFALSADPTGDARVRGRVAEAVVFRHLRAVVGDHRGRLTYFRKDDRLEADFVAEMPTGLFVIEVTAEREVDGDKLRSAAAVAKQLGAQGQWVVHGGMTETERDGVRLLPLERFLLAPERVLSW